MGAAFQVQAFNFNGFGQNNWADHAVVDRALTYAAAEGANTVVLAWAVDFNKNGTIIAGSATVTPENLIYTIQKAQSLGLDVFLKPHAAYKDSLGRQDNIFDFNTDFTVFNVHTFLSDWSTYLNGLAPIAEQYHAKAIVIGTENTAADSGNAADWTSLISQLRARFSGLLSYSPTFAPQYSADPVVHAPFWSQLDFIGVDFYPSLSNDNSASSQQLQDNWRNLPIGLVSDYYEYLRSLSILYGKPVMVLEGGIPANDGGLSLDWASSGGNPSNLGLQVRGLDAYFQSLEKYAGDWFMGTTIWAITPDIWNPVGMAYESWTWETVDKPEAAAVIRGYYTGLLAYTDRTYEGSGAGELMDAGAQADTIYAGGGGDTIFAAAGDDLILQSASAPGSGADPAVKLEFVVTSGILGGVAGRFSVSVEGRVLQTFQVVATAGNRPNWTTNQTFVLSLDPSIPISQIRVSHDNDMPGSGDDTRDLYFIGISLDGASILNSATYFPQSGASVHFTQALYDAGFAQFDTAAYAATVNARSVDNDVLNGGAGTDTVVYAGPAASFTVTMAANGAVSVGDLRPGAPEGVDILTGVEMVRFADKAVWIAAGFDFTGSASAQTLSLGRGAGSTVTDAAGSHAVTNLFEVLTATGGAAGDLIHGSGLGDRIFGGGGADTVDAGSGDDTVGGGEGVSYLRGDDGADSLIGGGAFDDINGNMGNDTVSTGAGEDYCVGGKDNDSLDGGADYDLVYGNLGNDTCEGGDGNDIVRGGQDNDAVRGGNGADFVSGDKGDDTMTGGAGADIFHTFGDAGIDRVTDFSLARGDRVQLDPGTVFTVSQVGADTVISMTGGGQMILVGVAMSTLTGTWIFGA